MKLFWFDTETAGLDPKLNGILTLSGFIEIDGKRVEDINLKMKPFPHQVIEDSALKINGITREEIATFPDPLEAHAQLKAFFAKYVNSRLFPKPEFYKLIPAGYNVQFDINMLDEFYKNCKDTYLWGSLDYHKLDVMALSCAAAIKGNINPKGLKLTAVAENLEIAMVGAHDARCDIETTKKVFDRFLIQKV
jgi:DNA polymerase-3 subunit epsilon